MYIQWLGHASFLIEGDDLRIVTDPYDPDLTHLEPIEEIVDVVLRSSGDDMAHCFVDTIPKGYKLLTATEYVPPHKDQAKVGKTVFHFMPSKESLIHKEVPRENAFYRFELEGIKVAHMGDIGNKLSENQLKFLKGTDILFVPAGGPPTIDLDDLYEVIEYIKPKVVIPMHFRITGPEFFMLPVEDFSSRFSDEQVKKVGASEVEFSKENLPESTRIFILEASLVKNAE